MVEGWELVESWMNKRPETMSDIDESGSGSAEEPEQKSPEPTGLDAPIPPAPVLGLDAVKEKEKVPEQKGWFGWKSNTGYEQQERLARKLRAQIRHLIQKNPDMNLKKLTQDELELKSLSIGELQDVLENINCNLRGPSPYGTTESLMEAIGFQIEQRSAGMEGLGDMLANDLDLISAVDSLLPISLSEASPLVVTGWRLVKNTMDCRLNADKRKRKRDAEQQEQASHIPPPNAPDGVRPVGDGKDNVRSKVHPEEHQTTSESPDSDVPDVPSAENVRPNKRVRKTV